MTRCTNPYDRFKVLRHGERWAVTDTASGKVVTGLLLEDAEAIVDALKRMVQPIAPAPRSLQ